MKIVHVCLSAFYIEGFGYQENVIPRYNKNEGHDVTIIASRFTYRSDNGEPGITDAGEYFNDDGIKVIRIDNKYSWLGKLNDKIKKYKGTYELLEIEKPDLIFNHGIQFLDLSEITRYIKDHPNCRLVVDSHAASINSGTNILSRELLHKRIYKKIIQKSLKYISVVFVLAPGCKEFAKEMYSIPDGKMEYLYLGADTQKINFDEKDVISLRIRDELNLKHDDFVFITGGKLSKGKNIKSLLMSLKEIHSKKIKLIIFGAFSDDIRDEMFTMIAQDDRVKYIGWLRGDEVYDYYLASDAAVFPGTKSALWEQAICSGLPIICRRWPGMEYVDVGGNVLFVENDIIELAQKIELLANDRELYNEMKQVACTKGFETFSYEVIARQAISLNK